MIFQGADFSRIIIVFISQGVLIVLFSILALTIIKRNRTRPHFALFFFYVVLIIGFILNIAFVVFAPTNNAFLLRSLYIMSVFCIAFSFVFNLLFVITLLRLEFSKVKIGVIVLVYAIVCLTIYLIPEGIVFSPTWVPTYSVVQFFVLSGYFTVFMAAPTIYFSARLYRTFEAKNLKRRLRLYLVGFVIIMSVIYGGIYFITTSNLLFKTIYGVVAFVLEILAGFLIYYGLGRKL